MEANSAQKSPAFIKVNPKSMAYTIGAARIPFCRDLVPFNYANKHHVFTALKAIC
jgi:hypothetical protein